MKLTNRIAGLRRTIVCMAVLAAACSNQAWYEGLKQSQRRECYRLPQSEVQQCLDEVNRVTYDEYRKEREALKRGN